MGAWQGARGLEVVDLFELVATLGVSAANAAVLLGPDHVTVFVIFVGENIWGRFKWGQSRGFCQYDVFKQQASECYSRQYYSNSL